MANKTLFKTRAGRLAPRAETVNEAGGRAHDYSPRHADNESWVDRGYGRATGTMTEWEALKSRNPGARMVRIDLPPYASTQVVEREDILNVGGLGAERWVREIEAIEL